MIGHLVARHRELRKKARRRQQKTVVISREDRRFQLQLIRFANKLEGSVKRINASWETDPLQHMDCEVLGNCGADGPKRPRLS